MVEGVLGLPGRTQIRVAVENTESGTALEILKKRYARGGITKNEFEAMKNDLEVN